jgi:hypothetical protein
VIYLSKTKSIVPPVKREAFYDRQQPAMKRDDAEVSLLTSALNPDTAVDKIRACLLRRGEEYFDKLKECDDEEEGKINRKVFGLGEFHRYGIRKHP